MQYWQHGRGTAAETLNAAADDQLEFNEADVVWSTNDVIVLPRAETKKHPVRKPLMRKSVDFPKSVPVNIPEWSKMEMDHIHHIDDDGNDKIPPHEYLARIRGASLSVHQGLGRTLKGRDLSRVRDAIWKQIGFED